MADPPTSEAALRLLENLLAILLAGGVDPQDAAWAADVFAGQPAEQFPLVVAYAAQLVAGGGDERFRFSIDVVIDGLLARAARR